MEATATSRVLQKEDDVEGSTSVSIGAPEPWTLDPVDYASFKRNIELQQHQVFYILHQAWAVQA